MVARRLIACLDVRDGRVVKGVKFRDLREAGDPAALAARYSADGIDEIVLLDISATVEGRATLLSTVRAAAAKTFIPLTVGGGLRSLDDARAVLDAGADKVSVNSAALRDPSLLTALARVYGSQAVIVAIDAKRGAVDRRADLQVCLEPGLKTRPPYVFQVYSRSGTTAEPRDAVEWAREAEARGAGEVLLTSIDRDGTHSGFDCELTAAVSDAVQIPVIASGGAGTPEHFIDVFGLGRADAALAASVFHFAEHGIHDLKTSLRDAGVPVRLDW
jgi:cyclase